MNQTYSKVRRLIDKRLSDAFPTQNGLKKDTVSPLLVNFALEHTTRKVQVNKERLEFNGTHQLLIYTDDVVCMFVVYLTTLIQYLRLYSVDFYSVLIRLPSSSEAGETRVRNMAEFCRRVPIVLVGFFNLP
jgi:hypothetical protein